MKKRILAAVLGLSLLVGCLTGCGGGAGSSEAGVKLTGEKISITAPISGNGQAWLENAADAFTKKTGIAVDIAWEAMLAANLTTILETEGVEKSDIYFSATYEWALWLRDGGLIEDLTDFLNEPDENEGGKSLNERMLAQCYRYITDDEGNKRQGVVPIASTTHGVVYNIKMMDYLCHDVLGWEEGHDYPINTKELFEVIDALNTTTKNGTNKELFAYQQDGKSYNVKPWVWSGSVGTLEFFFYPWLGQYEGQENLTKYMSNVGAKPIHTECEGMYVVYQMLSDLMDIKTDESGNVYSANSIPNCVSYNHTASQSQLLLGKALMIPAADWFYTEMEATIEDGENIGFMPVPWMSDDEGNPLTAEGVEMPKNEDGTYRPYDYYTNFLSYGVIPVDAQNKDGAKQFIRFLTSSEYLPKYASDVQTCMAYEFDESKVEASSWYKKVLAVRDACQMAGYYADSKLVTYGRIGFYNNPSTAPYSQLSTGVFGNPEKMVDSATGKELQDGETPTGVAVTENVYKYVESNHKAAVTKWGESKKMVGLQ